MKQKRMMLMLGGVLVVLIGCYVGLKAWNDHQQEQAEADEEAAKIRLVDAEGLTAVSYTDGESTLGFTLEEDTWRYTEDQEIPMNQDVVGGFADTVASLNATRELENPDDISDYELDSPSYTINYTTEDGEDGTIYIGNMTGEDYYAMLEGSDKVYTIPDDLPYSMDFDLSGYIQTDTVPSIRQRQSEKRWRSRKTGPRLLMRTKMRWENWQAVLGRLR